VQEPREGGVGVLEHRRRRRAIAGRAGLDGREEAWAARAFEGRVGERCQRRGWSAVEGCRLDHDGDHGLRGQAEEGGDHEIGVRIHDGVEVRPLLPEVGDVVAVGWSEHRVEVQHGDRELVTVDPFGHGECEQERSGR